MPLSGTGTLAPGLYVLTAIVNGACFARAANGVPSCVHDTTATLTLSFS
jgi:hypothetical protein